MPPALLNSKLVGLKKAFDAFHRLNQVPAQTIAEFHELIDDVAKCASKPKIQACKLWIVTNGTLLKENVCSTLFKYLAALAESYDQRSAGPMRLRILLLVNDLLHHVKYKDPSGAVYTRLLNPLQRDLPRMFKSAASFPKVRYPTSHARIVNLLKVWENMGYFPSDFMAELHIAVATGESEASLIASSGTVDGKKSATEEPWNFPGVHGIGSGHGLPASIMDQHVTPFSRRPVRTQNLKPMQIPGSSEPPSQELVNPIKKAVSHAFHRADPTRATESKIEGLNEMGHAMIMDPSTDKLVVRENAFGWSDGFLEYMEKRREAAAEENTQDQVQPPLIFATPQQSVNVNHGQDYDDYDRARNDRSDSFSRPESRTSDYPSSSSFQGRDASRGRARNRSRSYSRSRSRSSFESRNMSRSPRRRGSPSPSPDRRGFEPPANLAQATTIVNNSNMMMPGFFPGVPPPPPPQLPPGQLPPPIPGFNGHLPPVQYQPPYLAGQQAHHQRALHQQGLQQQALQQQGPAQQGLQQQGFQQQGLQLQFFQQQVFGQLGNQHGPPGRGGHGGGRGNWPENNWGSNSYGRGRGRGRGNHY